MPRNGYVWWYVDGLSADGQHGITIIAFIGSVFSPYYALARRRGRGDPENYCALNVALYGRRKRWAMTERGRSRLERDDARLRIGRSELVWEDGALMITIDERTAPIPSRVRGTVRLRPAAAEGWVYPLDEAGRHRWQPLAPCASVEVALDHPALSWSGSGYCDTNTGDEPIENGFRGWTWSRAQLRLGTAILYDTVPRLGRPTSLALRFDPAGGALPFEAPPTVRLKRTAWGMPRASRCEVGFAAQARQTLEDSPFYARSVVETHLLGEPVTAMHESLSLDRFRAGWMQLMLPFRMPRAR